MKAREPLTEKRKVKRQHGRIIVGFFNAGKRAKYATIVFYPDGNETPKSVLERCKMANGLRI